MRRRLAPGIALAWLLCLLAACAQPVPVDHRDYIGHWRGEGMLLVILPDGHAAYERVRGSNRVSISGPVHDFTAEGFRIGVGPMSARFKVQSPPARDGDTWKMTVDGVELIRVRRDEDADAISA